MDGLLRWTPPNAFPGPAEAAIALVRRRMSGAACAFTSVAESTEGRRPRRLIDGDHSRLRKRRSPASTRRTAPRWTGRAAGGMRTERREGYQRSCGESRCAPTRLNLITKTGRAGGGGGWREGLGRHNPTADQQVAVPSCSGSLLHRRRLLRQPVAEAVRSRASGRDRGGAPGSADAGRARRLRSVSTASPPARLASYRERTSPGGRTSRKSSVEHSSWRMFRCHQRQQAYLTQPDSERRCRCAAEVTSARKKPGIAFPRIQLEINPVDLCRLVSRDRAGTRPLDAPCARKLFARKLDRRRQARGTPLRRLHRPQHEKAVAPDHRQR